MPVASKSQQKLRLTPKHGIFTEVYPDPVGVILGTGFQRFESIFGIHGLLQERDRGIELLAVAAHVPGCGQFRRFIASLKRKFSHIIILEILNDELAPILKRYGFCEMEQTEQDGEKLTGMEWIKNASR